MTLDELPNDRTVLIAEVDWSAVAPDEAKRLQALGLDEGAEVCISHRGTFFWRDPIAVRIGAMTVALRRSHARAFSVRA
jgi:ferrous iron transport protein A